MTKPHYRRPADGSTVQLHDGLQNVMANLGTSRDKAAHTTYLVRPLSDGDLLSAYRASWLPRKIVDIIPMDATRRWRTWSADKVQISALEAEEKRLGLRHKLRKAMTSARLFGGAALYIGTGEADVSQPLSPDRIKRGGVRHLTVLTKRKLTPGQISEDAESECFGLPAYYEMQLATGQALRIHPSRLVILQGADLPDGYDDLASGWGDSVLQAVLETVKQADGTAANAASLVYEANVDVLHIPQLREMLLEPGGDEKMLRYLSALALGKGNNGMLVLDGGAPTPDGKRDEGTRYERKGANFTGLADIWDRFMQAVSGAADIPATRLLGMTPSGLNSTGESDLRNYYDRVQAMQEMELSPAMAVLDECLIRSATGGRDPAIFSEWRSLWQTTDKDRADIGATTAGIVATLKGTDLFPVETLQAAAANALIETGALPGLEAAVDDHGLDLTEPDEGDDLPVAPEDRRKMIKAVGDAEPRTLYVSRKVVNAEDIIAWAKGQGFTNTLTADDLHVTVAYSRTVLDWMKVGEAWDEKVEIAPGGPRIMEQFGEARVILFASSSLKWRHEQIKEAGASWDHPEYQPHITISYDPEGPELASVEPYAGRIILGPEVFVEVDEGWVERARVQDAGWQNQPRVPAGAPNSGEWTNGGSGMSAAVLSALGYYTGEGYGPINHALRSGREPREDAAKAIALMDQAFDGAAFGEKSVLYRGIGGNGVAKILGGGVRKGTIISDAGFSSTSRSESVAWQFARQYNNHFVMEVRTGPKTKAIDIAKYSDAPSAEKEVLFNRSSRFKVVSYSKAKKLLVVEALDD